MAELIDPRFEVVAPLAEGSLAHVFEVKDRISGARRALKLAQSRGQVRRLRNEFVRLSELRHPNIVRAHDFGVSLRGLPFYTMELVRGPNLAAFPGRADTEILGMLAMQALDALATLHARGFVHRDVKPSNLLVVGEGQTAALRLIDLGLIVPVGKRAGAAGTLPYIAPEVARGESVDGRADLYSLGAVLYEALLPEDSVHTVEEVAQRLVERPVAPNRLNPVIPAGLSAFVMRLLDPDPAARFDDADAAADALAKISGLRLGRGPARATCERLLRGGAACHRMGLMRRLVHLANQAANERHGHTVVIEGPVGVGKSPVLRELSMRLNLLGFRVLQLRSTDEPGAPVPALIKAARVLDPLVTLRESFEWPKQVRPGSRELSTFASRTGTRLIEALSGAPTAVILDDIHRAENVALEVLGSMTRALEDAPVLLICAGDPRADGTSIAPLIGGRVEAVKLGPLGEAEVQRLAAHRMVGLKLPAPALERLVEDSQGMPSLVERTLARLLVDTTIQRHERRFVFVGGRYRPAHHGDIDRWSERLAQVQPEQRGVLWAAAVLGREIDAPSVAALAGTDVEAARAGLGELVRLEILDPGEAGAQLLYKFTSRSLLAAAYQSVPASERRQLHDRAAKLTTGIRHAGRVEEQVEHLLKGSDDELAILAAVEAGNRAAAVYADRRAIEYFARAYARLKVPADPRAPEIALRLGKLFERIGELDRALSWYRAAAGGAANVRPLLQIEATLGLGAVFLLRGMIHAAEEQARAAKELLAQHPATELEAVAERLQALVAIQRGESGNAEQRFLEALAFFEASKADRQVIEVLLDLSGLARTRGAIFESVRYAHRALNRARRVGDAAAIAEATTVLGRGFLRAGRFATARRLLLRGLRVARASGDKLREAAVQRQIGNLRLRMGEFEVAIERYERALELARAVRARADEGACLHNIGLVRASLGDYRPAITALIAAHEITLEIGDLHGAAYADVELAHAYAEVGAFEMAHATVENARKLAEPLHDAIIGGEATALAAWVAARRGDLTSARALCADAATMAEHIEDPGNRALVFLYAGRCAVSLEDASGAARFSSRLLQEVELRALRDFVVAARCLHGEALILTGKREAAADELRSAVESAIKAGLRPLEIDARGVLGTLLAGDDEGAAELTRAMELMQELARALPSELLGPYLRRREAMRLRAAFQRERERVLGVSRARAEAPPSV